MRLFPGIADLSARELDLLCVKKIAFPELRPLTVDVSQNSCRTTAKDDHVSIATPKMRQYLAHLGRLSHGLEAIHFQGIHYGSEHSRLRNYSSSQLQDLAGNALEMTQFGIAFMTGIGVYAMAKFRHVLGPASSLSLKSADDAEYDDFMASIWA